ncbi:MAG: cupin domain-containing protein [Candidatus Woesearchaeota archaeon]
MRKPFKKHLGAINVETAHGGSGRRQLMLSKDDPISSQLHAMTKGFLAPGRIFDWHDHEDIDEFFLVTKGTGVIEFEDGSKLEYTKDDLIYIPSNVKHKIENTGNVEGEFFFVRLNH